MNMLKKVGIGVFLGGIALMICPGVPMIIGAPVTAAGIIVFIGGLFQNSQGK